MPRDPVTHRDVGPGAGGGSQLLQSPGRGPARSRVAPPWSLPASVTIGTGLPPPGPSSKTVTDWSSWRPPCPQHGSSRERTVSVATDRAFKRVSESRRASLQRTRVEVVALGPLGGSGHSVRVALVPNDADDPAPAVLGSVDAYRSRKVRGLVSSAPSSRSSSCDVHGLFFDVRASFRGGGRVGRDLHEFTVNDRRARYGPSWRRSMCEKRSACPNVSLLLGASRRRRRRCHPCTPYRRGALSSRISVRFVEPAVGPVPWSGFEHSCGAGRRAMAPAGRAEAQIRLQAGDVVLVSRSLHDGISDSPGTALRDVPI